VPEEFGAPGNPAPLDVAAPVPAVPVMPEAGAFAVAAGADFACKQPAPTAKQPTIIERRSVLYIGTAPRITTGERL
jgi:hypothetical protein